MTNTFNTNATHKALVAALDADKNAKGAMDKYAVALGKEFKRLDVTAKSGKDFSTARQQFYDAYGRRNRKLALIREAQKLGSKCSDDARRALGAAAKMWQKVSSAAIEGTTIEAQQHRKKPVVAKGAKSGKQGGATPGAVNQANEGDKATAHVSGPGNIELLKGITTEMQGLRNRADNDDVPTAKQLAALATSIISRIEIATGKQFDA